MSNLDRPDLRLRAVLAAIAANQPFALLTVITTEGSSPTPAGTTAIVAADGSIQGTVGGGVIEADAQRQALKAIASGRATIAEFDLRGAGMDDSQPVCGGRVRLLIDPTAVRARGAYEQAYGALARRRGGLWLITLSGDRDLQVVSEFLPQTAIKLRTAEPGPDALSECFLDETPALFPGPAQASPGPVQVFVNPLVPAPVLLVVGGGHVGQAVAAQASSVGFDLVVLDDRPEFVRPELFPAGTRTLCGDIGPELARFPLGPAIYVVLVTRDHQHDAEALAACLHRPAAYVGMIGSRRKISTLRRALLAEGRATAAAFDRVYAPIGLDLGAVTVPEIATSIVAQLVAVRRRGTAPRIAPFAEP